MRRSVQSTAVIVAALLLGACGNTRPTSGGPSAARPAIIRVQHPFAANWKAKQDGDVIYPAEIASVSVVTPPSQPTVDGVMTITFDYKLSTGDFATVFGNIAKGQSSIQQMAPREGYPLSQLVSSASGTTSLSWAIKSLRGLGQTYVFSVTLSPLDGNGDRSALATGSRGLLVIDFTPGTA